jgi:large subunit ribosomal protein L27e
MSAENKEETRKTLKKLFEEKYKNQSGKPDKKAAGASYFFNKLRF